MTRILAIDTATWSCSVALVRDGVVLAERAERATSNHAGLLPRLVDETLRSAGERPTAGDAVAVTIGPGSFTGLRIALSYAKGLAFAGDFRLVGVPTLDAIALAAPPFSGRLCVALDARKHEVYGALYEEVDGCMIRLGEPAALTAEHLAEAIGQPCTVVGDAVEAYGEVFRRVLGSRATLLPSVALPPRASAVARLAAARLLRDPEGDDLAALAPSYVRPPEAELTQSRQAPSDTRSRAHFVDKVPLVY
jgi:tRNA threonylcarbamoyladenosine biosynthesis protein TsaB